MTPHWHGARTKPTLARGSSHDEDGMEKVGRGGAVASAGVHESEAEGSRETDRSTSPLWMPI
eukprot:325516-Pyramimonas_sp.AAC.1